MRVNPSEYKQADFLSLAVFRHAGRQRPLEEVLPRGPARGDGRRLLRALDGDQLGAREGGRRPQARHRDLLRR